MSMGVASARVNCILHNSHSQLGEDLVLWPTLLLNAAPRPIFIELGAFDGVTYSNAASSINVGLYGQIVGALASWASAAPLWLCLCGCTAVVWRVRNIIVYK